MENSLRRRKNEKHKILRQHSTQDENHDSPAETHKNVFCSNSMSSKAETLTGFLTHKSKLIDEELTDAEDIYISEDEKEKTFGLSRYSCDDGSRQKRIISKEINKKGLMEVNNRQMEYISLPEACYEDITDTEDIYLLSDEEKISNKVSRKFARERKNINTKFQPAKKYSESESSASTDIEEFSDHAISTGKSVFSSVRPKVFQPFVIMNEKDDDLEDVFLSDASKCASSFQKFISKKSSSNNKHLYDDFTETEVMEVDDNELLRSYNSQISFRENTVPFIGLQGMESHSQQMSFAADKNCCHKRMTDIFNLTVSEYEANEASSENVAVIDNQKSVTEMKEFIKCSAEEKLLESKKKINFQATLNKDKLPLLKVTSDTDTDVEDFNSAIKNSRNKPLHQQKKKYKFNKEHCKNTKEICMEKNKLSLQPKRVNDEITSNAENAVTDVEEFDISDDDRKSTRNFNSSKIPSICVKMDDECKNLTKAVTSKVDPSRYKLSTLIADDTPLTDTEELVISDVDITSMDKAKNQPSNALSDREWTETDDSGGVRHVIQKKTIVTVSEPEEIMIMKGKGRKDFGEAKDNGTLDDDEDECTVTTRIVTKTTIKTDGQEDNEPSEDSGTLRESMQQILDDFMSEESSRKKQDGK